MPEELSKPEPQFRASTPNLRKEQEPSEKEDVFLLGGKDLEMRYIKMHLDGRKIPYVDKNVTWEKATIEEYEDAIAEALQNQQTPVAIELQGADSHEDVEFIDHHNQYTDRPASLLQVLERLGIEPNLVNRLVAANDASYIPGMNAIITDELERKRRKGFTEEQLERSRHRLERMRDIIRRKDREMQGVTKEMEEEAEAAITKAEKRDHGLVVVELQGDRFSPVTDRLHDTWPENTTKLVVICSAGKEEKEVWFFGNGQIAATIKEHFDEQKRLRQENGMDDSNEYKTVGAGAGFGDTTKEAMCLVVSKTPEEVVSFIESQLGEPE